MKYLKVKSNFAREKTITLGPRNECVLTFDREGYAKMPAHFRPLLEKEMTVRQGRYKIVEEVTEGGNEVSPELGELVEKLKAKKQAEKSAPEPEPEPEPVKVESKEDEKSDKDEKPSFFKKSSAKSSTKKSSTSKKENE